jgi:hypothetical protein
MSPAATASMMGSCTAGELAVSRLFEHAGCPHAGEAPMLEIKVGQHAVAGGLGEAPS